MKIQPPHKSIADAEWRILLIDGDEDDFILIRDMLKEAKGRRINLYWASSYEMGQTKLAEDHYDAVLVDNDLGARTGIELIRAENQRNGAIVTGGAIPLVLFTGRGSYEVEIDAMKAGATVYLSKDQLSPLSLERFIRIAIERKQGEIALKESEEKFAKAFRDSPAAQIITQLDDGTIVDVNESYEKLLGYGRAELIGRTTTEVGIYPHLQERDRILEILKTEGRVYNLELLLRNKSGSFVTTIGSMEAITVGGEDHLHSTLIDITERKRVEAALEASERQSRELIQYAPSAIYEINLQTQRFTAVNDATCIMTGYSREELFQMVAYDLLDAPSRSIQEERIYQWQAGKQPTQNAEYVVKTKDGRLVYALMNTTFHLDDNGRPLSATVVAHDITERKQVEDELRRSEVTLRQSEAHLRESEEKYRTLFEHSTEAVFLTRPDGSVQAANPAASAMFGWSEEELIRLGRSGILDPDDPRLAKALDIRKRMGRFRAQEYTAIRKGGERFPVEVDSVILPGKPARSFVILRDITERKQAEQALRQSESLLEAFFAHSPGILNILDDTFHYLKTDPLTPAYFGLDRQTMVGRTVQDLIPGFMENFGPMMQRVMDTGRPENREVFTPVPTKPGEMGYWQASYFPVPLPGGKTGLGIVGLDITEQKQMEETLREGEKREQNRARELAAILDAVPAYIWITRDPESRQMTGNRATHELLHSQPGDNLSMSAPEPEHPRQFRAMRDGKVIPPEELPVQIAAAKCMHVEDYEFDIVFEDGSSRRLMGNAAPLCDEHGNPAGAVGAFIDITDLRKIEQETSERIAQVEVQRRLLEHREMERSQLARDLHDGPIQSLGGLGFSLQMLQSIVENVQAHHVEEAREMIEQVKQDVRDLAGELRGVCNELRPPMLERFGFRKAVQAHLDGFREKHPDIKLDLDMTENPDKLPENIATALFRIYQEALNNVIRHSKATEISIRFAFDPQQIRLEIQDNGKGFPVKIDWVELARQGHFGLVGMKERAEAIGGVFKVQSSPGKGTAIRVVVPFAG